MIGVPGALMIALLLFLFLLLLATRGMSSARELSSRLDVPLHDDPAELAPCPPEFVPKIFSRDDWEFVSAAKSPHLERLFRRERKAVALLWVQQTSRAIQLVMREHAAAARQSDDLEFTTEAQLFLQYVQLMFVCGILFAVIQSTGPLWLRGLALHADSLSQRIAQAQLAFRGATAPRELHELGPS
jgi:hypothetical protein